MAEVIIGLHIPFRTAKHYDHICQNAIQAFKRLHFIQVRDEWAIPFLLSEEYDFLQDSKVRWSYRGTSVVETNDIVRRHLINVEDQRVIMKLLLMFDAQKWEGYVPFFGSSDRSRFKEMERIVARIKAVAPAEQVA